MQNTRNKSFYSIKVAVAFVLAWCIIPYLYLYIYIHTYIYIYIYVYIYHTSYIYIYISYLYIIYTYHLYHIYIYDVCIWYIYFYSSFQVSASKLLDKTWKKVLDILDNLDQILDIQNSLVTKFQLKVTIWNFWTQKEYF